MIADSGPRLVPVAGSGSRLPAHWLWLWLLAKWLREVGPNRCATLFGGTGFWESRARNQMMFNTADNPFDRRAYGWKADGSGWGSASHGGSMEGTSAYVNVFPDEDPTGFMPGYLEGAAYGLVMNRNREKARTAALAAVRSHMAGFAGDAGAARAALRSSTFDLFHHI